MTECRGGRYSAGCRCELCRATAAARAKKYRKNRRRRREGSDFAHGTTGYREWGCRCDVCTDAAQADRDVYRRSHRRVIARNAGRVYRRRVDEAAATAHRKGQEWTGPELEIAARTDLTAKQAAAMLGRTYPAVVYKRRQLRTKPREINLAGLPAKQQEG